MEAILKDALAKVKAIVDERLSLREDRFKVARSRSMRCDPDESVGFGSSSAAESDVSEMLFTERCSKVRMCAPRRFAASFSIDRARHPEGLPVPSVQPRLPDLNAANLSFAARLVIAVN